jgi:hypothetical protein
MNDINSTHSNTGSYAKSETIFSGDDQARYVRMQWQHYLENLSEENSQALREAVLEDVMWHYQHNELPFFQWQLAFRSDKQIARLIELKECEIQAQETFDNFELYQLVGHIQEKVQDGSFQVSPRLHPIVMFACVNMFSRHDGEREVDAEKKAIWVNLFSQAFVEFEAVFNDHLQQFYKIPAENLQGSNSVNYQSIEEIAANSLRARHGRKWIEKISAQTPLQFKGQTVLTYDSETLKAIEPAIMDVQKAFNLMFVEGYMKLPFTVAFSKLETSFESNSNNNTNHNTNTNNIHHNQDIQPYWVFEFYLAEKLDESQKAQYLDLFKKALSGQLSDGWGENMEQQDTLVKIHEKYQNISVKFDWNNIDLDVAENENRLIRENHGNNNKPKI